MTKVTDKIKDWIDPQHKGFRHTWLFKVVIGFALLVLLGIIYNVFIRGNDERNMTEDEQNAEAARKAELDTLDVVGDYLWPDVKAAKGDDKDDDDSKEKEGEVVEHAKEVPMAEAATEEDIENATGQPTDVQENNKDAATHEKKAESPKIETMDKPTVEEIE